jgi:dTDP-4-amino-4,6-dideoxygalactose transaminase
MEKLMIALKLGEIQAKLHLAKLHQVKLSQAEKENLLARYVALLKRGRRLTEDQK